MTTNSAVEKVETVTDAMIDAAVRGAEEAFPEAQTPSFAEHSQEEQAAIRQIMRAMLGAALPHVASLLTERDALVSERDKLRFTIEHAEQHLAYGRDASASIVLSSTMAEWKAQP